MFKEKSQQSSSVYHFLNTFASVKTIIGVDGSKKFEKSMQRINHK